MAKKVNVCIIGAGIAGLLAANKLARNGRTVVVLDKGRGVGGRMSVRRFAQGRFDHGAQFFTVRDERFARLVEGWQADGLVLPWSEGFRTFDANSVVKEQRYYRCKNGMNDIAKHLAKNLDVQIGQEVNHISFQNGHWTIGTVQDGAFHADGLLMTPPVPQTLKLLDTANFEIDNHDRDILSGTTYEPCIALLLILKQKSNLPHPGGLFGPGEPIQWMADNRLKGISPQTSAVTIHAGARFSREQWQSDDEKIMTLLTESADKWLGSKATAYQVHRWRYSKPVDVYPDECYALNIPAPLILAGDAFGGPRVEGAALSGLAAAEAL